LKAAIYFDLETGGLLPKHPNIQLAAVIVDEETGEELEAFEAKIKFDPATADPAALAINHYDPKVWELQARDEISVARVFANLIGRYASISMTSKQGNPYKVAKLVGHNAAAFDGPRLFDLFKRHGVFLPADPRVRCTVQRAMWFFDETDAEKPKNLKLETLCAYFGVPIVAHDALSDVRATAALARAIRRATREVKA
jgi:exonuclease I